MTSEVINLSNIKTKPSCDPMQSYVVHMFPSHINWLIGDSVYNITQVDEKLFQNKKYMYIPLNYNTNNTYKQLRLNSTGMPKLKVN